MTATHERRVAAAVAALAGWSPPALPGHVVDQVAAATVDADRFLRRFHTAAAGVDAVAWARRATETDAAATIVEAWARVALACAGARYCQHLGKGGPQPVYARLPLHRVDCTRCVRTVRRPPADEDGRCDWCGDPDVARFWPIVMHVGPVVALGDACETCGTALRAAAGVTT